jgi:hypothetical protein
MGPFQPQPDPGMRLESESVLFRFPRAQVQWRPSLCRLREFNGCSVKELSPAKSLKKRPLAADIPRSFNSRLSPLVV